MLANGLPQQIRESRTGGGWGGIVEVAFDEGEIVVLEGETKAVELLEVELGTAEHPHL